jgi:hypothetical protein
MASGQSRSSGRKAIRTVLLPYARVALTPPRRTRGAVPGQRQRGLSLPGSTLRMRRALRESVPKRVSHPPGHARKAALCSGPSATAAPRRMCEARTYNSGGFSHYAADSNYIAGPSWPGATVFSFTRPSSSAWMPGQNDPAIYEPCRHKLNASRSSVRRAASARARWRSSRPAAGG